MRLRSRTNVWRLVFAACLLPIFSPSTFGDDPVATVDSPSDAAIRQQGLAELKALLDETNTLAAMVLHKDKVVAQWYWNDANAETSFEVWSVSKSYASTCIGILIDQGKIDTLEDKVGKYVPSWNEGEKADITLRHLLEQTSGLEESGKFFFSKNQLTTALEGKILTTPGDKCRYNNAGCNVLSAIITAASGKDPEEFMRETVWQPLEMNDTSWRRDKAGNVITYAGIQSTTADLARFGQLFLHRGKWNGRQLLSADWIEEATNERIQIDSVGGRQQPYGLLWWVDFDLENVPHNYNALGLFGNNLTVIPELDLIGVRLVGSYAKGGGLMRRTPEWVSRLAAVVASDEE